MFLGLIAGLILSTLFKGALQQPPPQPQPPVIPPNNPNNTLNDPNRNFPSNFGNNTNPYNNSWWPRNQTGFDFRNPFNNTLNDCIVEYCRVCPNTQNITCASCQQGYYLRTFTGGDKVYNACWSTTKLIFGILGGLLAALLMCYLCNKCR